MAVTASVTTAGDLNQVFAVKDRLAGEASDTCGAIEGVPLTLIGTVPWVSRNSSVDVLKNKKIYIFINSY